MFISPTQLVESLALRKGDIVADFGCGAGAYVFPVSKAIGDRGKVYAIDIHKEILEKINREADKLNITNIDTILSDIEDKVSVESLSCDAIILSNVLSEVFNTENIFKEINRILKPNGLLLVIDWKKSEHIISLNRGNLFPEENLIALLAKNNFDIKRHFPAGDHHYAILAIQS